MAAKFRKPKDMVPSEGRVPVSARIRESMKGYLEKEAKSAGLSFAELVENVLEDYVKYLKGGDR